MKRQIKYTISGASAAGNIALLLAGSILAASSAKAQQAENIKELEDVVVSASRTEQRRFDAPAAIDSVQINTFSAGSPLVNLSELLQPVPGIQVRQRENYAQDLQLSVRGFGTRSTFGVRGVRILIDGIPATMPDGQGQVSAASLTSASRIEVLRGPMAQLYGNAAGGVVQIFTREPPKAGEPAYGMLYGGAGSYGQWQLGAQGGATWGAASDTASNTASNTASGALGALADTYHYSTDGYRDHSSAEHTHVNAKLVARPSADTTLTGIFNQYHQPADDPLGLTRADFERNPRQSVPAATFFDTRKDAEQRQAGAVLEHKLSAEDTLNARAYAGNRQVNQTLAFSGAAPNSSGGVVDLDRDYGGVGIGWTRKTRWRGLPLNWTVGMDADRLSERRRGFVNNQGTPGDLRRNEDDDADNLDFYGQVDWALDPQWNVIAGVRSSRVRLSVDDDYVTAASPNDSGSVRYRRTSPVAGVVWHASDTMNVYANVGQGFETPTLAEIAYRADGAGPNFSLRASTSDQAEVGLKIRSGPHSVDLAVFYARSKDEIVPLAVINGRSIYQNVDRVVRRGVEASWQASAGRFTARAGYTWLDAQFREAFRNAQGTAVDSGNRLPGAPEHSLFTELQYRPAQRVTTALEMRVESKVFVDDINSDAAPGYAVWNARAGYEFRVGRVNLNLFGRIDNLLDRRYAGSVIVNESNGRFFEPAAQRRFFVGVRAML